MMKKPTFFVIVILIFILLVSQFRWVQTVGNYYSISTNQEYKLLFDDSSRPTSSSYASSSSTSTSTSTSSTSASNIREWGCNRTETPFIFVHIHKAGGGSVKARISASSLNYTKESPSRVDGSYYPIIFADNSNNNNNNNTTIKKARLCWSCFSHRRPSNETAYEKTLSCHASTPIGRAIGCPIPTQKIRKVADGRNIEDCRVDSDTCRIVYVGHNLFGSEFHWLPAGFLKNWWINTMTTSGALPSQLSSQVNTNTNTNTATDPMLLSLWDRLQQPTKSSKTTTKNFHKNNNIWCSTNNKNLSRPQSSHHYERFYKECSLPLQRQVDKAAIEAVVPFIGRGSTTWTTKGRQKKQQQQYYGGGEVQSWSAIYASLPVLRVTMVRDPFSWLVSKFIWHKFNIHDGLQPHKDLECDNIETAIIPNFTRPQKLHSRTTIPGWLTRMSLEYLMWLCGEDCIVRYWKGESTLEDLQKQAEDNLRYGLAVVGLLESGDDMFYEMLSARVQYIDTSLNPDVNGGLHSTRSVADTCKDKFTKDKEFQQKLLSLSPELRVINHLYQVAVEVNRFQINELRSCSKRMDSFLSNRTESNRKPKVINLKNRNPRPNKKKALIQTVQQQPQPQPPPASSKFVWDDLDLSKTIKCGIDKCFVHSLDGNIGYLIGERLDLYDKLHRGYEYASYLQETYNVTSMVLGEPVKVQQRPYDLIENRINPMIYKPPIKGDKTKLFCSAANQKPWPRLHPNRTCQDFPLTIQKVLKAPNHPNTTLFVHTHFMQPEQFQKESQQRLIQLRNIQDSSPKEFLEKFQISLDQLTALVENEPAFLYDLQFIIDFSTGIIHHIDYDRVLDGRKRIQEQGEDKYLKNFGTRARIFLGLLEEMKNFVINKLEDAQQ